MATEHAGLETSDKPCEKCGLRVKKNWKESQIAGQIHSLVAKIRAVAERCDRLAAGGTS